MKLSKLTTYIEVCQAWRKSDYGLCPVLADRISLVDGHQGSLLTVHFAFDLQVAVRRTIDVVPHRHYTVYSCLTECGTDQGGMLIQRTPTAETINKVIDS